MPAPGQSPERSAKALLLEGVNDSAVDLFRSAGFTNVERLTKALGREVRAYFRSDPKILGGVVVRVGDRIVERGGEAVKNAIKTVDLIG